MGGVEKGSVSESRTQGQKQNPSFIGAILLMLGIFAPHFIVVYGYDLASPFSIQSLFWTYSQSSFRYFMSDLSENSSAIFAAIFPLLLLRMVPVFQIYRYYNGNTTRKRALIASLAGDGLFLFMGILSFFIGFLSSYSLGALPMLPLPFQMIFGFFVLLKLPIPEPTTPWKSEEKPKSWWNKDSDSQEKKPADEDDQLW